MSLARSASGPGGLTINTGAANTGGMASAGGLFGAAQQKPAGTGLFGATASATTPASTTGGLFGAAATTTTTQAPAATATTGGLFGAAAAKPATGGLFGTSTATPAAQPATGGLFGNTQAKPATGGLFGASTTASTPAAQPATGGGLFGGAAATTQPAASATGGLFGASAAQPAQPAATGGLFGQTKPATGGLFGQSQAGPAQPAAQVSAVQINYDTLRPRSRFDDLAQPIQDEVALIDKGIQRVIKMKDEIGQFMPQHEKDVEQLARDVKFVESKFKTVQDALNRDIQTVKALQDVTKKNITDAQLSFKATDNLKLPSHYHQNGLFAGTSSTQANGSSDSSAYANAQDLITYFNRICDDVEKYKTRLDEYRGEIERDMPGVENGLYEQIRSFRDRNAGGSGNGSAGVHDQLSQILSALRETGNAIVVQAGRIADTRERLSRLQAGFLDSGLYTMGMSN